MQNYNLKIKLRSNHFIKYIFSHLDNIYLEGSRSSGLNELFSDSLEFLTGTHSIFLGPWSQAHFPSLLTPALPSIVKDSYDHLLTPSPHIQVPVTPPGETCPLFTSPFIPTKFIPSKGYIQGKEPHKPWTQAQGSLGQKFWNLGILEYGQR